MSIIQYQQNLDFKIISHENISKLIIIVFYAEWNQSSLYFKQKINTAIPLFGQFQNVVYIAAQAQKNSRIFKQFNIQYTPTLLFVDSFQNIIKKYEEQDIGLIFDQLALQSQNYKIHFDKEKSLWLQNIKKQLNGLDVALLMKGNMQSIDRYNNSQFVNILKANSITFTFINTIQKYKLAQWIQYFDGFSDYPQLYVKGKLLGSFTICKDLHEKGELLNKIPKEACKRIPIHIFEELIEENKCLIFVDGFTFEGHKVNDKLSKLYGQYPNLVIYNVSLCQGLKQILLQRSKSSFPILFVEGKHIQY